MQGETFKETQRSSWDGAAPGWRAWYPIIERGATPVNERLLRLAQVEPGQRVLDVATGFGEPALTAARRVGSSGRVTGTDLAAAMLAGAGERAAAQGLTNVAFVVMDGEALDFPDESFEAVLCRFGLMYFPDPDRALRTIRHLLVHYGRFGAAIWDMPSDGFPSELAMGVARERFAVPDPPTGAPTLYGLAGGVLEEKLAAAGFVRIVRETQAVTLTWPSAAALRQSLLDLAPALRGLLNNQAEQARESYWLAFAEAAAPRTAPDGSVSFTNTAVCVGAQRP